MRAVVFTRQFKFSPDGSRVIEYPAGPEAVEVSERCAEVALEVGAAVDPENAGLEFASIVTLKEAYNALAAERDSLENQVGALIGERDETRAEIGRLNAELDALLREIAEMRNAQPATEATSEAAFSDLPEFFPNVDHLRAAGLTSIEAVTAQTDTELEALPGIGKAAVKKIRKAIQEQA